MGTFYYKMTNYPKAIYYYEKSLRISNELLGEENVQTATIYNNLG